MSNTCNSVGSESKADKVLRDMVTDADNQGQEPGRATIHRDSKCERRAWVLGITVRNRYPPEVP